jgi:hypothetical protein
MECIEKNSIKLISEFLVFCNLEELDSVIKGIKYCLKDDGIFSSMLNVCRVL